MLPHSATRWQTLWGGTASLHCGQTFKAGAVKASWLRRIPCFDRDFRLLGTATSQISARTVRRWETGKEPTLS